MVTSKLYTNDSRSQPHRHEAAACRLGGSKVYIDRIIGYTRDMMKAGKLRGEACEHGLTMTAINLTLTLLETAWPLVGSSQSARQEADDILQEIHQVCNRSNKLSEAACLTGYAEHALRSRWLKG